MNSNPTLSAIATDLDLCALGIALTRGKLKKRYIAHKAACMAAIAEIDPIDAKTAAMTDDELLDALFA